MFFLFFSRFFPFKRPFLFFFRFLKNFKSILKGFLSFLFFFLFLSFSVLGFFSFFAKRVFFLAKTVFCIWFLGALGFCKERGGFCFFPARVLLKGFFEWILLKAFKKRRVSGVLRGFCFLRLGFSKCFSSFE